MDALISISDDLITLDSQFEASSIKCINYFRTLISNNYTTANLSSKIENYLLVNDKSPIEYVISFKWNTTKYRCDRPIPDIVKTFVDEVNRIDVSLKTKMSQFTQSKTALTVIERKNTGNLLVRNLNGIINPQDIVTNSEYLEAMLIVVPKQSENEWLDHYETLSSMVVPRSVKELTRDDEYILYVVYVFRKAADEFKAKAREHKYTPRDYTSDIEQVDKEKQQQTTLASQLRDQWTQLLRLVKYNFSEVFSIWIHLKVIRMFVESVLRYGLPPAYLALQIVVNGDKSGSISEKKLSHLLLNSIDSLNLLQISKNINKSRGSGSDSLLKYNSTNIDKDERKDKDSDSLYSEAISSEWIRADYKPFVQIDVKWTGPK